MAYPTHVANVLLRETLAMSSPSWGAALRRQRSHVRIVSGAPLRYKTGHSKTCRFCAWSSDKRAEKHAFRTHHATFLRVHFDALGQGAEVITAVVACMHLRGLAGEGLESLRKSPKPKSEDPGCRSMNLFRSLD